MKMSLRWLALDSSRIRRRGRNWAKPPRNGPIHKVLGGLLVGYSRFTLPRAHVSQPLMRPLIDLPSKTGPSIRDIIQSGHLFNRRAGKSMVYL